MALQVLSTKSKGGKGGKVEGSAFISRSISLGSGEEAMKILRDNQQKHRMTPDDYNRTEGYKAVYVWAIENPRKEEVPWKYAQLKGQVIWVAEVVPA